MTTAEDLNLVSTSGPVLLAILCSRSPLMIGELRGLRGRQVGSTTYSCSQVTSTSVIVELTIAGFIITSFPSDDVEMIGCEI